MHRLVVLFLIVVSYLVSVYGSKWEDCGIPLTRKIYYQGVTVSPSTINITKDNSLSININAQTKDYTLQPNSMVNLLVTKDDEKYYDGSIGDLCQILYDANRVSCPLQTGAYSFTYQYNLPPLPSGNYSVTLTTFEPTTGNQIGCLSVQSFIVGLGADQCSYTSSLSASFVGTAQYLNNNNAIQVGPLGPKGEDLGYSWGTFKSITASPDLVGYSLGLNNYVWGLSGSINPNVSQSSTFEGTLVIGYQHNVLDYQHVQLIYQGTFSWNMTPSSVTPYIFQSGRFELVPTYSFPAGFAYPLNLGNLGPFAITKDATGSTFVATASRKWCRCNCAAGGLGTDRTLIAISNGSDKGMSGYKIGTIVVCVVGGLMLIAVIVAVVMIQKTRPKPVVYEDPDMLDPQKPDYGTMAINEAFAEEEHDFRV